MADYVWAERDPLLTSADQAAGLDTGTGTGEKVGISSEPMFALVSFSYLKVNILVRAKVPKHF